MRRRRAIRDSQEFRRVNRSVRIAGHSTKIGLEAVFWRILDEIADGQGISTIKLIAELHEEAAQSGNHVTNFTSLLRTTCLLYAKAQVPNLRGKQTNGAPPGPPGT